MKDIDKLKSLLTEFGVGFTEESGDIIKCYYGSNKVEGYNRFYTTFQFNNDGKFVEMGAWE